MTSAQETKYHQDYEAAVDQMRPLMQDWLENTLAPCIRRYGFQVSKWEPNLGDIFGMHLTVTKQKLTMWVELAMVDSAMYDGAYQGASFRLITSADMDCANDIDLLSHFPFQFTEKAWCPFSEIESRWAEFLAGLDASKYADDLADWTWQNASELAREDSHSTTLAR